jgi:homocitrate synthase NifV
LDTTLRDGEQMPGVCFSTEQKLRIAAILDAGGVRQIEAGVPAISRREKETVAKIVENRKNAVISAWSRLNTTDIEHAADAGPDIIHVSVPVSYPHIYSKLRKNKNWVLNQLSLCLETADKRGFALSVGFEDAFRADAAFLVTVSRVLLDAGVKRIRLSDTVGTASPSLCRTVVEDLTALLGGEAQFGFHGHNDLGLAAANTLEAAKAGCLYSDVTVGGVGERAGNCDLAQLVNAGSRLFDWGITPGAALRLQNDVFEVMGGKI